MDLAFILDSSGSIGKTNYLKEKHFVKQLARSFGLAPGQSRAALVLYSSSASVQARFGQYQTLDEFDKAVDGLPYERGTTRIDLALEKAAQEIFPQARQGVPKIAILITDGKQTQAADAKGLTDASEPLRKAGVRVLAVGIGSGVDPDELRLLTESDEDVVVTQNFADLLLQLGNLTSRSCQLAGERNSLLEFLDTLLSVLLIPSLYNYSSSITAIVHKKEKPKNHSKTHSRSMSCVDWSCLVLSCRDKQASQVVLCKPLPHVDFLREVESLVRRLTFCCIFIPL